MSFPFDKGKKSLYRRSLSVESQGLLAVRMDTSTTPGVTYVGTAPPGTPSSYPYWRIYRLDERGLTAESLIKDYAAGNANFDKIWDDRESLSYS